MAFGPPIELLVTWENKIQQLEDLQTKVREVNQDGGEFIWHYIRPLWSRITPTTNAQMIQMWSVLTNLEPQLMAFRLKLTKALANVREAKSRLQNMIENKAINECVPLDELSESGRNHCMKLSYELDMNILQEEWQALDAFQKLSDCKDEVQAIKAILAEENTRGI